MFDLFRRFSAKEIRKSAEDQAAEFTDQLRQAAKSGDTDAIKQLVGDALVPKDAVSLNGYFYDEIKLALIALEKSREIDPFLETFEELVEVMKDFYREVRMAAWIFHQVCRELGIKESFEEKCIGAALSRMRDPKNRSWVSFGYQKFVIEWVEAKYGPMSCTKERFWESWEKEPVERIYKASLDDMSRDERISFANNLMCIDNPDDIEWR